MPGKKLALQAWIKLWIERGVDMRMAMALAGKFYKSHPTLPLLLTINNNQLLNSGVFPAIKNQDDKREKDKDRDLKRVVGNALRGMKEANGPKGKGNKAGTKNGDSNIGPGCEKDENETSSSTPSSSKQTNKRRRDPQDDLVNPLMPNDPSNDTSRVRKKKSMVDDFDFREVLDMEIVMQRSCTTNRAPCMTAWAYIICEKMGFDRLEALSLASVFTSITSTQHALSLGNIYNAAETKDAQQELADLPSEASKNGEPVDGGGGSAQPWVGLMKRRLPVIQLADGSWRGLTKGQPVEPQKAHSYITRNFGAETPYVIGALRLLARCYSVEELNERGYGMYVTFRPEVRGWGDKGTLFVSNIIDMIPQVDGKDIHPSETKIVQNGKDGHGIETSVDGDASVTDGEQQTANSEDVYEGLYETEHDAGNKIL